jgi:hypothetical protein
VKDFEPLKKKAAYFFETLGPHSDAASHWDHTVTQRHICREWNAEVSSSAFCCEWCILSFSPNLVLLSIITATLKIVESLPHFLSPYMDKLLHEVSIQSAKWQQISDDSKVAPVVHKLKAIR